MFNSGHLKNNLSIDMTPFVPIFKEYGREFRADEVVLFDYFYEVYENNYNYGRVNYNSLLEKYPSFNFQKQTFLKKVKFFVNIGLVKIIENDSSESVYNRLNLKNSNIGCLFCGEDRMPYHQHHYPIRKEHGGEETINLCPNCHGLFHQEVDHNNKIKIIWSRLGITKEEYEARNKCVSDGVKYGK